MRAYVGPFAIDRPVQQVCATASELPFYCKRGNGRFLADEQVPCAEVVCDGSEDLEVWLCIYLRSIRGAEEIDVIPVADVALGE